MKAIFTCIALLVSLTMTAQTSHHGSIKGTVLNAANEPVASATITLRHIKDSSLIKVGITDPSGKFDFENIPYDTYLAEASFTGYEPTYNQVTLDDQKAVTQLQLTKEVKTLKDITVSGRRPLIEAKAGKLIMNVDNLLTAAGSTALETLEKAPGITLDKDGNLTLRGKSGVIVLIDDRLTHLSGQELANYLRGLPASAIERIEIMNNPPAKYDAAGTAGMINIQTKKSNRRGFNGSVNASVLQSDVTRTNGSLQLNYRRDKVNLFGNYSYGLYNNKRVQHIVRKFPNEQTDKTELIFDQVNDDHIQYQGHNYRVGMDYYANKQTILGFNLSGKFDQRKQSGLNTADLQDAQGNTDSMLLVNNNYSRHGDNLNLNLNMRHNFNDQGNKFSIDLDYLSYHNTNNQRNYTEYMLADGSQQKPSTVLLGDLPSDISIYAARTDFTFPQNEHSKIETGVKASYVTTDNDAVYHNVVNGIPEIDYGKTNHFLYDEYIYAGYVNYNRKLGKKWSLQTGLRGEFTHAKGHQLGNPVVEDSAFTKDYFNLFPTVYLSYNANDNHSFNLNYGRRINRPDYEDLNPFIYYLDEYTYEKGNPLLQPEFIDKIELTHIYKGILTTSIFYSHTSDEFVDVLKQINEERKTFVTEENLASQANIGLSVYTNLPLGKMVNTTLSGEVTHSRFHGPLNEGILDIASTNFSGNMNTQIRFKKGWSAEVSGFYRSGGLIGQIGVYPMWRVDAGIQKRILKNKGSLSLTWRDVFDSHRFSGYVRYQDIDVKISNDWSSPWVGLSFSYNFGKPIKNLKQHRHSVEEQSRVD